MSNVYTRSPVVGVLCIDVDAKLVPHYGPEVKSYIDASYVKFLEFAGCQVVPVWYDKDEVYYREIMKKLNGILFPGGGVFIDQSQNKSDQTNLCVESVGIIYEIACEMNKRGRYFPIWGTCLGFELLLYHAFKDVCSDEVREKCKRRSVSTKLDFTDDFAFSKMFKNMPEHLKNIIQAEPFAFHSHGYCITKEKLMEHRTYINWRITALNQDDNGLELISTVEHKLYPFYGSQFHPEKVLFDYFHDHIKRNNQIVECAQYFANFFASECRKSPNVFSSRQDKQRHLIQNFPIEYTGGKGLKYQQCYLFKADVDYPEK